MRIKVKMPRRIVRCSYGGHHFQVEIKEGYVSARAIPQAENLEGLPGHKQACPICNRLLFIKYLP
jgi:hypothetical protein